MEPLRHTGVVRFGAFEVSLASNELRKAGLKIRVQQQPMKLLEILLERPGEVVAREELRSRIWADENFGDFDQAVNIAIAKLRNALGDSAESPRYIETLPKRGYRFIAEVSVVDTVPRAKAPETAAGDMTGIEPGLQRQSVAPTVAPQPWLWPKRRTMVGALVAVLSLTILAVWLFRSWDRPSVGIRSIAVLPLDNLSGDASQDYFSDGMTDELITDLAKIKALRVISRTSVMRYKGTHTPLQEIARKLNVDAIVEGSVPLRRAGPNYGSTDPGAGRQTLVGGEL
jgi:DNA-binding winged helix-turn-helix (wHTH) protein